MTKRGPNSVEVAIIVSLMALPVMLVLYAREWDMLPRVLQYKEAWIFLALLFVVGIPLAYWHQARFARNARLVVGEQGIRMESGLPPFLRAGVMSDWALPWDEVQSTAVLERFGVIHLRRRGGIATSPIALRPTDWTAEGLPERSTILRERQLWQALARYGVFERTASDARLQTITFDLWRHAATRTALLVCGALVLYAAIDTALRREAWAEWNMAYNVPHAAAGIVAAALAAIVLLRAAPRVPCIITGCLATMVGFSAATASYSALIRLNQIAGGTLEAKAYRRNASCDALIPFDAGLPIIEYTELAAPYWCSQPAEKQQEVGVRKGLFGLYQVDLTPHTEAIRRFRMGR